MLQLRFVGTEKPAVWLVDEHYILGSGPGCHIHLSGPAVQPRHAQLSVRDETLTISPMTDEGVVIVNGSRIYAETLLNHNAQVLLGECALTIVDPKRERPVIPRVVATTSAPWVLQSKTTALANKLFAVEKDVVVGRARECDLCLAVAHLSRRHARLFFDGGALWVEDLGSANGTFLNGQRLTSRARLHDSDELAFDTLVFVVRGESTTEPERLDDKTSLRPALATDITGARALAGQGAEAEAVERPIQQVKPTLSRPLEHASGANAGHNGVLLWGGICVAVLLTTMAIFYFAA